MSSTRTPSTKQPTQGKLTVAHTLAQLLERLERSREPVGAAQYRAVVQHLLQELDSLSGAPELGAFLDLYPAAAELYENTAYAHAGLCRSPLELSLQAELRARETIERVMRRPQPGLTNGQS